jgi:chromate transporter
MAGWQSGLGLALACAVMAGWQSFAPSFVWIFAGAPYAERLRQNRFAQSALAAVTAAVLGVIANLALIRFKVGMLQVILACAVAGFLVKTLV